MSMVYNFVDKKSVGSGVTTLANRSAIKNQVTQNRQLAKDLHKPIIRKLKKEGFIVGNIWGADLADMQLIIKFSEGTRFLLRVINSFSERAWVVPLNDKKDIIILNAFQKILDS